MFTAVRRPVGLDGVDLLFVFTSAFSLQPSAFRMAPSVMDLSHLGFELLGKWRKGFANGKGREAD
jgi:hypothetical protein